MLDIATQRSRLAQTGKGILAPGRVNSCCIYLKVEKTRHPPVADATIKSVTLWEETSESFYYHLHILLLAVLDDIHGWYTTLW